MIFKLSIDPTLYCLYFSILKPQYDLIASLHKVLGLLLTFGYSERAQKLLEISIDLMWDKNKHYFFYQKRGWYTNKIKYIRWSQAWMFYALIKYQQYISEENPLQG